MAYSGHIIIRLELDCLKRTTVSDGALQVSPENNEPVIVCHCAVHLKPVQNPIECKLPE